jgi:hypothetical protein
MEFKGNLPNARLSQTDWERVRRNIAEDAPIPYDPNDPDDGPYDPNDDAAVDAFFDKATIWVGWPKQVMVQKDGVPVAADESDKSQDDESRAKAS